MKKMTKQVGVKKIIDISLPAPYASEANAHLKTQMKLIMVEGRLVQAEICIKSILWAINNPSELKKHTKMDSDSYIVSLVNGYFISNGGEYKMDSAND